MRRSKCAWLFGALVALVMGCDDSATQTQDTGDQQPVDLTEVTEVADQVVETSYLSVVNPADDEPLKIFYNSDSNIVVGYYSSSHEPLADAQLDFSIVESTENCHNASPACVKLTALSAPTGEDGLATMRVTTGVKDADARIRISVTNQPDIQPVDVVVQARAKESYDLTVQFEYAGSRTFSAVKPMLFDTANQATCDAVFTPPLKDPNLLPTAAKQNPDAKRSAQTGKIDNSVFWSLPNTKSYIAFAYAVTESGMVLVYGCADQASGSGDTVTVVLQDVPITISGTYDLTSNFDLLSGLPRRANPEDKMEAGDWVDTIISIFEKPGETLWKLIGPYVSELVGMEIPAGLDKVVGDMIDSAIENYAPDWVNYGFAIAGDIGEFATSMQLVGEFVFQSEPDATGVLPGEQIHRYTGISLRWRLPCIMNGTDPSQCDNSRITMTFNDLQRPDLAFDGTFTAAVVPCSNPAKSCLEIQRHGLTIPYGEILLAVVEGWVFPQFFGADVDSLESFVERVLLQYIVGWYNDAYPEKAVDPLGGCASVGAILGNLAADDGIVNDIVTSVGEYACDEGKNYLINELIRKNAEKLTLDTVDNLQLATVGDCEIKDTDGNLVYDKIGDALNDNTRCKWDIQFKWGETETSLNGLFHAVRGGE